MAFTKKTWKDRLTEYPTRRRLTKSDGTSELVTVSREEGEISQEGDAFSAANMNDLENRIADGLNSVKISVDTTLTQSGMAADAKAVGDAIKNVDSNMYYDPTTDIKYLKNKDGEWVFDDYGGLDKVYLYKEGVTNTSIVTQFVAGGTHASAVTHVNPTFNETSISLTTTSRDKTSVVISENAIDFTPYTVNSYSKFGCKILEGSIEKEYEMDISSVNGSYHIAARNWYTDASKIVTSFGIVEDNDFNSGAIITEHYFNNKVTPTDDNKVIKVIEFWFRK